MSTQEKAIQEGPGEASVKSRLEQIPILVDVASSSLTQEMILDMTERAVKAMEMLDDLMQPEVMALIQKLPSLTGLMDRLLDQVKKLEEHGTLSTLIELGNFASIARASMTGPMVTDTMERAIAGMEMLDDMAQKGIFELANGMVDALDRANAEQAQMDQPYGTFKIAGMMKDPDVRRGLTLLMLFLRNWGRTLKS